MNKNIQSITTMAFPVVAQLIIGAVLAICIFNATSFGLSAESFDRLGLQIIAMLLYIIIPIIFIAFGFMAGVNKIKASIALGLTAGLAALEMGAVYLLAPSVEMLVAVLVVVALWLAATFIGVGFHRLVARIGQKKHV